MKSFLKYFLMLFAMSIQAAAEQNVTSQAFNVLAQAVQPKIKLTQKNFKPAIESLTSFLCDRYPQIRSTPTQKLTKPENMPVVTIRQKKSTDQTSDVLKNFFPNSSDEYQTIPNLTIFFENPKNPKDPKKPTFVTPLTYIWNDICFEGNVISLFYVVRLYTHLTSILNNQEEPVEPQINRIIASIISNHSWLDYPLNRLFFIDAQTDTLSFTAIANIASILFKLGSKEQVITILNQGADPLVIGKYSGPNFINPKGGTINIENQIGFLTLLNSERDTIIPDIIDVYSNAANANKQTFSNELQQLFNEIKTK